MTPSPELLTAYMICPECGEKTSTVYGHDGKYLCPACYQPGGTR